MEQYLKNGFYFPNFAQTWHKKRQNKIHLRYCSILKNICFCYFFVVFRHIDDYKHFFHGQKHDVLGLEILYEITFFWRLINLKN